MAQWVKFKAGVKQNYTPPKRKKISRTCRICGKVFYPTNNDNTCASCTSFEQAKQRQERLKLITAKG